MMTKTFNRVLMRALTVTVLLPKVRSMPPAALAVARQMRPDRVVLDLSLGGSSGLALIEPLLQLNGDCRIVVLTG